MTKLVLHGYSSSAAIDAIGKPRAKDLDGSSQASSFNQLVSGVGFPNPTTVAQTWNRSLARAFGRAAGMECAMLGIDGWYAPATNLHRTPLGGRNYEYYSEDPLISGQMAAETIAGSKETGTYCYLKHLVANEQDSYRDSLYTWMTEQSLRELYLEPFRIAVQQGGATGMMTAYNRLGGIWAGGCHALLADVLRGEWGFRGSVITDYSDHHVYMNADQMLRAGGSLFMDGIFADGSFDCDTTSPNFKAQLRRSTKDVIYSWLNARAENLAFNESAVASGMTSLERPVKTRGTSAVTLAVALVDAVALVGILLKVHHVLVRRKERRGK
jgi:beta-glucosidase